MFASPPIITETGLSLMLRAAGGEKITFTRFQAGSGTLGAGETPKTMTALKNPVLTNISITSETVTDDPQYVEVTGAFDNQTDVSEAFRWTELGLFAKDENNVESLYAYGYDDTNAEVISPSASGVVLEQELSCVIAIGKSTSVSADVIAGATYVEESDFNSHVSNTNNPHHTTYAEIGAAAASHTHKAGDRSGVLPIARGGTGVSTLAALTALFGSDVEIGMFIGDNAARRDINLGFQPAAVLLVDARTGHAENSPTCCWFFTPSKFIYHNDCQDNVGNMSADEMFRVGHGGAAITSTGFAVGRYAGGAPGSEINHYLDNTYDINRYGGYYMYFAFKSITQY